MEVLDRQKLINEGKVCPYCDQDTDYVDSKAVYSKSYGMIYLCKPCEAWVGVHSGTDNAKGRLANAELRFWKMKAHAAFDPVWKSDLGKGEAKHIVRKRTYMWLADEMKLERSVTHIGFFDVELCKQVIEICNKYHHTEKITTVAKPIVKPAITNNNINLNKPSGLSAPAYQVFDSKYFDLFKKKFGNNFWYDEKRFCYTIITPLEGDDTDDEFTLDFYPKANKILIRQKNRWIEPGLQWLLKNFIPERLF